MFCFHVLQSGGVVLLSSREILFTRINLSDFQKSGLRLNPSRACRVQRACCGQGLGGRAGDTGPGLGTPQHLVGTD